MRYRYHYSFYHAPPAPAAGAAVPVISSHGIHSLIFGGQVINGGSMGCPSEVEIGDNLVFTITTHDPDTGVLTDATGNPAYRVYEDETGTAILTGSMAKLDDANTTGFYSESIACTSGNGFENGKSYNIYITATVDSDLGGICYGFKAYDQRKANATQVSGDATAADNLELFFDGTGYAAANSTVGTVTTLTGHTAQTGDSFARLGAPSGATHAADNLSIFSRIGAPVGATIAADISVIDGNVDSILVDTAEIGVAGAGLTDLGGMSTAMKAEVNTEVLDVLNVDTFAELSGVPAATSTIVDKINWLFALARNKGTQTSTTKTLRNDADSADIATSAISDDGTTFTRNEWS